MSKRPKLRLSKLDRETIADGHWWKELSKYLPWKLFGWTYRRSATFFTPSGTIGLTGAQRNELIEALTRRKR